MAAGGVGQVVRDRHEVYDVERDQDTFLPQGLGQEAGIAESLERRIPGCSHGIVPVPPERLCQCRRHIGIEKDRGRHSAPRGLQVREVAPNGLRGARVQLQEALDLFRIRIRERHRGLNADRGQAGERACDRFRRPILADQPHDLPHVQPGPREMGPPAGPSTKTTPGNRRDRRAFLVD
jgi:hypothetical protein